MNNSALLPSSSNHEKLGAKVSAVLFDLDDTLIDSAPAWRAGLVAAFAQLIERRPELPREEIQTAWQGASRALGARLDAGALSVVQVRERRWREALAALGITDDALAAELEATLAETFIGGLRLFDDAADALDLLRGRAHAMRPSHQDDSSHPDGQDTLERRYHLGIITNGAADEALDSQYTKARRTGLLDRVDSFLASDAGVASPTRASSRWRWSVRASRRMRRSTSAIPSRTTWWGPIARGWSACCCGVGMSSCQNWLASGARRT